MNQCLSCDLPSANIANFPCAENFANTRDPSEYDEQPQCVQNLSQSKRDEHGLKILRHCKSSPGKNHENEQNEQKKVSTEDALPHNPKLNRSTEKLREFLICHADFLDSLCEKSNTTANVVEITDEVKELPAELWWVPPFKLPTSRSVPSVARSATCSGASSTSTHPRTKRSAEDLRQRVDSVCNLVEAMGIMNNEKVQKPASQNSQPSTARSDNWSIPLLRIPSTAASQQSSKRGDDFKKHASHKSVGSQCTMIEPQTSTIHHQTDSTLRFHAEPSTHRMESYANNAVDIAPPQQHVPSHFTIPQTSLSVSDLACIHIVNPMLSKLARLCTAQGQQYLNVLEELEKACNDFHNACKYQGATK